MTYSIIQKSQLEGAQRIDAEYYRSDYLEKLSILKRHRTQPLLELTNKIDVGYVSSMTDHFQSQGIPLLRTQNVRQFHVDMEDEVVYVSEDFHKRAKKTQVFPGYVLIARSGTIGEAGLVANNAPVVNSADIILIDVKKDILPEYLTAFLNSKYGKFQIERNISGGLQGHINLSNLEEVLIHVPPWDKQRRIREIVLRGLNVLEESRVYYKNANNLLLEELGLADFEARDELAYVMDYADVEDAERMDAEYFQPKYTRLIDELEKHNIVRLGEIAAIEKGTEPGSKNYHEEGKPFIRVSNISKEGFTDRDQKYLGKTLYEQLQKEYEPRVDEVLLTKDATPGTAYVLKEPVEGIIASGILRLQLKSEVEPEYIALCLNSIVGQLQVERDTFGSVIAHWRLDQVKNTEIPLLSPKIQRELSELVQKSHAARKKSKDRLEEAKRKIEEMIESAASC